MTQTQLHHAIARATGESLRTIKRRGFGLADPATVDYDPDPTSIEENLLDGDAWVAGRRDPILV